MCNVTPVPRHAHVGGVPRPRGWRKIFASDSHLYDGSDPGNGAAPIEEQVIAANARSHALHLVLPPLAVVVFEPVAGLP